MNSQNVQNCDESDFDFSVIGKKASQQARLNFSVQSLLQQSKLQQINDNNPVQHQQEIQSPNLIKDKQEIIDGSFLEDLQKLQKELSFQTQTYNVYNSISDINDSQNPTKSNLYAKSNSHLKTTKEQSKELAKNINIDDYGYLVIDFSSRKKQKIVGIQKLRNKVKQVKTKQKLKSSKHSVVNNISVQSKYKDNSKSKSRSKNLLASLAKCFSAKNIQKQKPVISLNTEVSKENLKEYKLKQKTTQRNTQRNINTQKPKIHSRSKSPICFVMGNMKNNKNLSKQISKQTKQSNKNTRDTYAYSQYYGFNTLKITQRTNSKSISNRQSKKKFLKSIPNFFNKKKVIQTNYKRSDKSQQNISVNKKSKEKCLKFKRVQ